MATRRTFSKWRCWKSIVFCLWPPSTRIWSLKPTESRNSKIQYGRQATILQMTLLKINRLLPIYISIVPLKFEVDIPSQSKVRVWKKKIQYGRQAAILKVRSLKINRLLPMATVNRHMKFEIEIPQQTCLMLRKPCRLQTDRRTDRRKDGRTRWIHYIPLQLRWEGKSW